MKQTLTDPKESNEKILPLVTQYSVTWRWIWMGGNNIDTVRASTATRAIEKLHGQLEKEYEYTRRDVVIMSVVREEG